MPHVVSFFLLVQAPSASVYAMASHVLGCKSF